MGLYSRTELITQGNGAGLPDCSGRSSLADDDVVDGDVDQLHEEADIVKRMMQRTQKECKGGNKKAGLPGLIGRTAGESIALRNTSQNLNVLRNPVKSMTKPSRPIGIRFFR